MIEITIALVIFLFPLAYSPGPGNMFFAANGARFGFRATLPANAGYHGATLLVTIVIGLGFDRMASEVPLLLSAIRYLGAAYVLYLAWGLAKSGTSAEEQVAKPAGTLDGVALLLLNPKAYLIIALIFTQFTSASIADRMFLIVWISLVFTLNNFIAFSLYAGLGDRLAGHWRNREAARGMNLVFAVVLAAVALWMIMG